MCACVPHLNWKETEFRVACRTRPSKTVYHAILPLLRGLCERAALATALRRGRDTYGARRGLFSVGRETAGSHRAAEPNNTP